MGIFRIREEIIKSEGVKSIKWRVLLCDNKGEPMDEYYTSFVADKIICQSINGSQQILDSNESTSSYYYDCESIRLEESSEGTTVIF